MLRMVLNSIRSEGALDCQRMEIGCASLDPKLN